MKFSISMKTALSFAAVFFAVFSVFFDNAISDLSSEELPFVSLSVSSPAASKAGPCADGARARP